MLYLAFPVRLRPAGLGGSLIGEFWLREIETERSSPVALLNGEVMTIQNSSTKESADRLDPYLTNFGLRGYTDRLIQISTEINDRGTVGLVQSDQYRGYFEIRKLNSGSSELQHSDRVAFRCWENPARPFPSSRVGRGWWSVIGNEIHLVERDTPGEAETFVIEWFKDLKLYWNGRLGDNYSTTDGGGESEARVNNYQFVRTQGHVFVGPAAGRAALKLFWHEDRGDFYLTATEEGAQDAIAAGYVLRRIQGYILENSQHGTVPLKVYWNPTRQDHISTVLVNEEHDAADAGYQFVRIEGHIFPSLPTLMESLDARVLLRSAGLRENAGMPEPIGESGAPLVTVDPRVLVGDTGVRLDPTTVAPVMVRRRRGARTKALVLSGGGAKGCFEVGAVQHLWEQGYRPDIICGVSVGALNAVKLAEGEGAHTQLLDIWREINTPGRPGGVFQPEFFAEAVKEWIGSQSDDVDDWATIGANFHFYLSKLTYAAAHLHAVHSMVPLRQLVRRHVNISAIRESGIELRVGMVDMESGQYFSVGQPEFDGDLAGYGRVEVEPDHRMGETWLTRPVYGASSYVMDIKDAVYSSCVQPVFMDPMVANLRLSQHRRINDERLATLPVYHPPAIQRLLDVFAGNTDATGQELNDALKRFLTDEPEYGFNQLTREGNDAWRGDLRSYHHHLFDGGLRDTLPIRTAMRLGAREIMVITGDRLQRSEWRFGDPGKIRTGPGGLADTNFGAVPAAQYFLGLMSVWFNETARSDMMLALAQNEFLGWLYRCFNLLDGDKRQQIVSEFNQYWESHGTTMRQALGGSSWLGGSSGFHVSAEAPSYRRTQAESETGSYGVPFHDEGCKISYIAPDRDLLGPLEFTNREGIETGIALGRVAAERPLELSYPVPDRLIIVER
jgi:predicted acylesterase/phospholipase RssA